VSAALVWEPAVAVLEVHGALQLVVFADVHVRIVLPPLVTLVGLAASATLGAAAVTVTWVDCVAVPWVVLFVHVSVNVVVAVRSPVRKVPLVGSVPLQPFDAEQVVAPVELHVKVAVAPYLTVLGLAENAVMVTGAALTLTLVD
jgi:hypothetical protein